MIPSLHLIQMLLEDLLYHADTVRLSWISILSSTGFIVLFCIFCPFASHNMRLFLLSTIEKADPVSLQSTIEDSHQSNRST